MSHTATYLYERTNGCNRQRIIIPISRVFLPEYAKDNLLTITQDQNRTKECNDQNLIIPISRIFFSIVHVRQLTNYKPRIRTPLNEHDDLFMLGCTPQNTLDEYTHKINEH